MLLPGQNDEKTRLCCEVTLHCVSKVWMLASVKALDNECVMRCWTSNTMGNMLNATMKIPSKYRNRIYVNIKVLFKARVKTFKYFTAVWTWRNKGNSFLSCAISGIVSRNVSYKLFSHSKLKQACNKIHTSKNQMIHYHMYEGPLMNWQSNSVNCIHNLTIDFHLYLSLPVRLHDLTLYISLPSCMLNIPSISPTLI